MNLYIPPFYRILLQKFLEHIQNKSPISQTMDIQRQAQSVFQPMTSSFARQIMKEQVLIEGLFAESIKSPYNIILTLTKNHIIAKSCVSGQSDTIFVAEINFDLKFQTLYFQEKKVHSKKIGLKFLISNTEFNCFYTTDLSLIECWSIHLSKLINQRGFHELFKPIRKLGKGNFASVYEVERVTDLKRFAVKAFSKQNTFAGKNGKQSLINELSVMRALDHQNVLRLESVYESQNSIYVVEQVLEGGQLFNKIQKNKGQFTKSEIKEFMQGLLQGLAHMHKNRIMHRDLKPQNIMMRNENTMEPVIVDFGLATNADIDKYLFYRCGTPGYVAPEIVALKDNIHIEPECDIFSAGVIFHLMLMKKPLFEGTKYDQVYKNNKHMNFNLNAPAYQKLQHEELELLKKMLIENPKDRITAEDALKHPYFGNYQKECEKIMNSPQLTSATERTVFSKRIGCVL